MRLGAPGWEQTSAGLGTVEHIEGAGERDGGEHGGGVGKEKDGGEHGEGFMGA